MSKHDADNRSNQLNPNNSAYFSSRGIERPSGSGDDDEAEPSSFPLQEATYRQMQERIRQSQLEERQRITKIFRIDILFLNGMTASLSQATQRDNTPYYYNGIYDHIDILEKIEPALTLRLESIAGSPLAKSIVRDDSDQNLFWISREFFDPTTLRIGCDEEEQQKIDMWRRIAKPRIPSFEMIVLSNLVTGRIEYNEPVTPENYKHYDWPSLEACVSAEIF